MKEHFMSKNQRQVNLCFWLATAIENLLTGSFYSSKENP